MRMIPTTLPLPCLNIINEYLNQSGKPTPYYRQLIKNGLLRKRYLIGKGSPSETSKYKTGVDCSGFICHIINSHKNVRVVIKSIDRKPLKRILFYIRPIENINVKALINSKNSTSVKIRNLRTGDLVHIGNEHAMLIYKTSHDTVYFAHASEKHKIVELSTIKITNPEKPLEFQVWKDMYYQNKFTTTPNSGVKRLRRWLK